MGNVLYYFEHYDDLGRLVQALVNSNQNPGKYQIEWEGTVFSNVLYFSVEKSVCRMYLSFNLPAHAFQQTLSRHSKLSGLYLLHRYLLF
jgi:hypothetical protein